ncbi:UNVERIFIED_CONTAM: hypothetical protein HDU68_005653 [Siphonaria sp. JEL0065]|nr:hypothetical protein HDU68_005653 [Siphonaria sp. JEL0065]
MASFSCNLPCGTKLAQCHHSCPIPCHAHDPATHEREKCKQTCDLAIESCPHGHECKLSCDHNGPCTASTLSIPSSGIQPCLSEVSVSCTCGSLTALPTTCYALDAFQLSVVSTGVGSRKHEVRVDCSASIAPSCIEARKKKLIIASFSGKSVAGVKNAALGFLDSATGTVVSKSVFAGRLGTEAVAGGSGPFNALWFVGIPHGPDLGRREISGFVRSKTQSSFEFLNMGGGSSGSSKSSAPIAVPEFPKQILNDMKSRNKQTVSLSIPGVKAIPNAAESPRDHVVWFIGGRTLSGAEVKALCGGREGWVVPMFLGDATETENVKQNQQHQLEQSLVDEEPDTESAVIPQPPVNLFKVLDDTPAPTPEVAEEEEEDVALDESLVLEAQQLAAAKKAKKKKKKSKAAEVEELIVEKAVEKIVDPTVAPKALSNVCPFAGCKEKLGVMAQYCMYCDRKYCMTHRFPEVHLPDRCGIDKKKASQNSFKNDAKLGIAIGKKETQGGKSGSLAKEREDAKKRLAEKIKNARK